MKPEKTVCAINAKEFAEKAIPILIKIGDQTLTGEVKQFSTGSFGWYVNSKAMLTVDGKMVPVQVGANLIVVGSKDAARDGNLAHPANKATNGSKSASTR